jgi:uncharacterized protein (DUF1330 family)
MSRKFMIGLAAGAAIGAAATTALYAANAPTPKAYMIAELEVSDAAAFARDYAPNVQSSLDPFGGRYLARGGKTIALEGRTPPTRMVLVEFPSLAAAQGFYASPKYQALAAVRHRIAKTDAFIVEGVAPAP